jgi:hypothetical protein
MKPPGDDHGAGPKRSPPSVADTAKPKRAARPSAPSAGLQESRIAAERQRERTDKLRKLRLERDAARPPPAPPAPGRAVKSTLNLARTQRTKKS